MHALSNFVSDNADLLHPSRVYSIAELKNILTPEFSAELDNLFCSNISVIFYDYLPTDDFVLAAYLSDDFVGCTGDDSFSKIISLGKVLIYYAFRHKYRFWIAFLSLVAAHNLPSLYSLLDLYVGMPSGFMNKASDPSFVDRLIRISLDGLLEDVLHFKSTVIPEMKANMSLSENLLCIHNKFA